MSFMTGTVQNDNLLGTSEDDRIFGLDGDDFLDGLGGDDLLNGGQGNDILRGGDGNDTSIGGKGNDRLYAGKGQDNLIGGKGDDVFVVGKDTGSTTLPKADVIFDFGKGKDLIELKGKLSFGDLNISQGTGEFARDTVVKDQLTGEVLAVLKGTDSGTIDSTDFISAKPEKGYTFTKIADSKGSFSSFDGEAAINDQGTVVFQARSDDGSSGIFTGSGGATTTIADTNGELRGFTVGNPEINNQGTVVYAAFPDSGGVGIFSNSGGTNSTIVSGTDYSFRDVDINDKGTIAFSGSLQPGGITSLYFVNNGVISKVAGPDAPISTIEGSPIINTYNLDINNSDAVVFRAVSNKEPFTVGTFTINNGVASKITDINSSGPAINDEGTVVFSNEGIFKSNGGVTTTIADNSGPFNSVQVPVINNKGDVAFAGRLDEYTGTYDYGIFTGPDPVKDQVIGTGDTVDGSTVQNILPILSDNALNNLGQIALEVRFTDGTEAIYRADPISLGQGAGASSAPLHTDGNPLIPDLNSSLLSNSGGLI